MVLNRLIITQGDPLMFHINHTENGSVYSLKPKESYFLAITTDTDYNGSIFYFYSKGPDFDVNINLEEGMYAFEIGIKNDDGPTRVILPAMDERRRPLNQLIVLRRLYNEF